MKTYVFIDLETTSLGKSTHICQIGAISYSKSKDKFEQYILPDCEIPEEASNYHRLKKRNDQLYLKNKKVQSLKPRRGLKKFVKWIEDVRKNKKNKLILVAHNAHRFDGPVLINNLKRVGIEYDWIYGFVDTLLCFRHHYPGVNFINNLPKSYKAKLHIY